MDKFFYENVLGDEVSLADINVGEEVSVFCFLNGTDYKTKRRLLELGFVKNARVVLCGKSFLKDVLLFEVNGFMLSVRKVIAKNILCRRIIK